MLKKIALSCCLVYNVYFNTVYVTHMILTMGLATIRITCPCDLYPPYTPLLYSKTGVYRGIHFFLIFALKHRLWVLIRTASMRRF